MYLIYTDESGDAGIKKRGGTPFFVISGIIIHESYWNEVFQGIVNLRRLWHVWHKTPQRIPLHATDIVNGHGDYHHSQYGLTTTDRLDIYKDALEYLAGLTGKIHILNVFIRKNNIIKTDLDVFEWAWKFFIQRINNTLDAGGYLGTEKNYAMLITDRTHDDHLRKLLRQMRAFNYIKSKRPSGPQYYNSLVTRVLDDPVPRDSKHSYFVQMADLVAFALARRDFPRPNLAAYKFETYFDILDPVLLKAANPSDPHGVYYWP